MRKIVFIIFAFVSFQLQAQDRYFLEVDLTWKN